MHLCSHLAPQPSDDADPAEPTGKPLTPPKQHEGHLSDL